MYIREAKPCGLADGPEIPGEEQQQYREKRTDSAKGLETAKAKVEAGIGVVGAAEVIASADSNPENDRE